MKTKQDIKQFIAHVTELEKQAKELVIETLRKIGKPIEFDWENICAPCMVSSAFDDDVTDAYISKLWLDGDLVKANLRAFYIGEDRENIDLSDECNIDWLDVLDWVSDELED